MQQYTTAISPSLFQIPFKGSLKKESNAATLLHSEEPQLEELPPIHDSLLQDFSKQVTSSLAEKQQDWSIQKKENVSKLKTQKV